MFLVLPKPKKELQQSGKSIAEQIRGIKDLIKEKGSFTIHLYYTFTGVTVACYAGYLYTLVVLTGLLMNRFGDRFNKYRLASFGTLIVEASAVMSLVTFYTKFYWMCFVCAVLWGCSETFFQSNTAALISLEYKGKLEGTL
ncbi:unnamed protein product [Sphagnum balticum]